MLQRLLDASESDRGKLPEEEVRALRLKWYDELARSEPQRQEFRRLAKAGGAEPFADTRRPQAHRNERSRYTRDRAVQSTLVNGLAPEE